MRLTIHTLRDEIRAILQHHPEAHVARQQVLEALDGYHKSDGSKTVPIRIEDIAESDFYLAEQRPDRVVFRGLSKEELCFRQTEGVIANDENCAGELWYTRCTECAATDYLLDTPHVKDRAKA